MKETGMRPMTLALQYFAEGLGGEGGGEAAAANGAEGEGSVKTAPGKYRNIQSARPGKEGGNEKSAKAYPGGKEAPEKESALKYKNIQRAEKGKPHKAGESMGGESAGDALDTEFEEMIRGRYRDAWQKRADAMGIIAPRKF